MDVGMNPLEFDLTLMDASVKAILLMVWLDKFSYPPHCSLVYGKITSVHRQGGRLWIVIHPP